MQTLTGVTLTDPAAQAAINGDPALASAVAAHPGGTLTLAPMMFVNPANQPGAGPQPLERVSGACGQSWSFLSPGPGGHVYDSIGFDLNSMILKLGGSTQWVSPRTERVVPFGTGFHLSGNWAEAQNFHTGSGEILSWMVSTASTLYGVCATPYPIPSVTHEP